MQDAIDAQPWICETQRTLGSLVTKPKLSTRLLSKPPFRFIHDIVMEVIRLTGFAHDLYDESECDAANFTVGGFW